MKYTKVKGHDTVIIVDFKQHGKRSHDAYNDKTSPNERKTRFGDILEQRAASNKSVISRIHSFERF